MNLPCEVVIMAGDDRFDRRTGRSEMLEAHELLNAAGRAGRAGMVSQGIVLLVPSKVITFEEVDDGRTNITNHCFELREAIFSKSDQCLNVNDPISMLLDQVNIGGSETPLVNYFYNRLPVRRSEDDRSTVEFLNKSFGRHKAIQEGTSNNYSQKVQRLIEVRGPRVNYTTTEIDWKIEVANKFGVNVLLIESFDSLIERNDFSDDFTIQELTNWIIPKLYVFKEEVFQVAQFDNFKKTQLKCFNVRTIDEIEQEHFENLSEIVQSWMNGGTFIEIENAMGTQLSRVNKCKKARLFLQRCVADLSYILGIFTNVLESKPTDENPAGAEISLNYQVASISMRYGFNKVEMIGLYLIFDDVMNRRAIHRLYDSIIEGEGFDEFDSIDSLISNLRLRYT